MLTILLCLPALLTAETIQRSLQVEEGGTSYTQTITFDFDNRVQIIDVPAHNNIVHSRSHFYFNQVSLSNHPLPVTLFQGKVVESHPDHGNCYVKPLPVGIAPMEKLASVLGKRKVGKILSSCNQYLSSAPVLRRPQCKQRSRGWCIGLLQHLGEFLSMRSAIFRRRTQSARLLMSTLWSKYPAPSIPTRHLLMHQVATVSKLRLEKFSKFSSTADAIEDVQGSLRSGSCSFPSNCMWQTCWVGSDSCFWTVNCPENDKECDDMIHNSDFHVNDDPITCKACFNTACPGCEVAWENCGNGAEMEHRIPACENGDVQEGWDCGND